MEVRTTPELAVVEFVQALRDEAPKAWRSSGRYFEFPLERRLFRAAKRLAKALGLPVRRLNRISLFVGEKYVTYVFVSAEEQWLVAFMPKDGGRLLFKTRGVELTVPYVHAYVELYNALWVKLHQRQKKSDWSGRYSPAHEAAYYYWRSWWFDNFDRRDFGHHHPDIPPFFF